MTAVERQSRAAKQEREKAAKLKADMLAAKQAKAALVASMAAGSGGSGSGGIGGDDGGDNGGDNGGDDSDDDDDSDYEPSLQGASEDEMSEDDEAADHLPRREVRPEDVHAELDEDEQLDGSEAEPGVMGTYLKAVFDRLHSEVCGKASRCALEDKWLLGLLKAPGADWWLRAGLAESVCAKLGLEFSQPSYYRDIYVWLPDMRWGHEAMPPCVECETAAQVGPHCFRDNHFARRIGGLKSHYFTMSRRYICGCCEDKAAKAKQAAEDAGLSVEASTDTESQYTFMGWDARSRARLPFGYGEEFPAFLTHRGGIDTEVIDLMRPLYDKGLRPEALSATILELHTKAHTKAYIKSELLLERDRRLDPQLASRRRSRRCSRRRSCRRSCRPTPSR